ncbi:MAG: methyltransferase [Pseudomonadota bacterium]
MADFARVRPGQTVIDLGTGAGVVALALAWKMKHGRILAVELQPRLAECARRNAGQSPPEVRLVVLEMDWAELTLDLVGGRVEMVVCNPPYRSLGTGRISPDREEALARHEYQGSAAAAARTAARLLQPGGKMVLIYPAARLAGLLHSLKKAGFEPKKLRLVHSRSREQARLALVEAVAGGGEELTVLPPLFIFVGPQKYSAEVQAIISGENFGWTTNRPGVP